MRSGVEDRHHGEVDLEIEARLGWCNRAKIAIRHGTYHHPFGEEKQIATHTVFRSGA